MQRNGWWRPTMCLAGILQQDANSIRSVGGYCLTDLFHHSVSAGQFVYQASIPSTLHGVYDSWLQLYRCLQCGFTLNSRIMFSVQSFAGFVSPSSQHRLQLPWITFFSCNGLDHFLSAAPQQLHYRRTRKKRQLRREALGRQVFFWRVATCNYAVASCNKSLEAWFHDAE